MQTAHLLHAARESFGKLGVRSASPALDFAAANEWKEAVVKQMTSGVASLFKANGVEWVKGDGLVPERTRSRSRAARTSRSGRRSSRPARSRSARRSPGSSPTLCVDSTGLLARTEVPRRLVVLGGGIIGCEFASIFRTFGSEVTIVEMLDRLIPQEDEDASEELAKAFGKKGIALELGKQCTGVEQAGNDLTVRFGEGETVEADLMLVSVGRAPSSSTGSGSRRRASASTPAKGVRADEHRRTSVPHIYAVGDCAGYWQLAHTAFREGEVAAENACGHEAVVDNRAVPRPIYTDPEIAAVG